MPTASHILVGKPIERTVSECDPFIETEETVDRSCERLDRIGAALCSDIPISLAPGLVRISLPDGYQLAFSPLYGTHILALDSAAQAILNHFEERQPLVSAAAPGVDARDAYQIAVRLAAHGLLTHANTPIPHSTAPETLSVWLHVTNACNLACGYCYVAKSNEAMDEATGLRAIDTIIATAQRHGYSRMLLKYAGGEATLNFDLVKRLHDYAAKHAQANGIVLEEAVLSNGVALTSAMLTYLRDADIRLMISLDGPGAVQDRVRPQKNGRGSFTKVVKSVDRAIALGIKPHIAIVVSAQSAPYLAETIRFALDRGLRFNLSFERDHTYASGDPTAAHAAIIAGMQAAFETITTVVPSERLIDSLVDRASFDRSSQQVCGAGESLLVIDHRGRIARCQTDLQHPVSSISAPDPLGSIRLEPTGFQRIASSAKEGCRTCSWRQWCAGGCPAFTYQVTGRNDIQSPYCGVYKQLYPEAIRLEGLRLVKWANSGTQLGMEVWL